MDNSTTKGKLYLIPTTLGDNEPLEVLPLSVKQAVERIDHYVVENEKTARRFIKRIDPKKSQPSLTLFTLNKYTDASELTGFLDPCIQGHDTGIISEAGCPGVADPGAEVVALAHRKGIQVVPLTGPSSILLALMGSGMNGQSFTFNGYLPIDRSERKQHLKVLEKRSRDHGQTQIFIETPYRNNKLMEDLIQHLKGETRLCVAADLTLSSEFIQTRPVKEWKRKLPDLHKRPAIFLLLA